MSKYLHEIDFLVSNLYAEKSIDFRKKNGCLTYLLSAVMGDKIESSFRKVALSLWPINTFNVALPKLMKDTISNVLVIEDEYDIDDYFKITDSDKKNAEVISIARNLVSKIPDDIAIYKKEVLALFDRVEESNYRVCKEYGRWVSNAKKTHSIKLFVEYAMNEIVVGVVVKNISSDSLIRHQIKKYDTFNSYHLDKIGKIEFVENDVIKYTPGIKYIPTYVHEPIEFKLP